MQDIRDVFHVYDTDGSGELDREEFVEVRGVGSTGSPVSKVQGFRVQGSRQARAAMQSNCTGKCS
jgi:hypothetical protein